MGSCYSPERLDTNSSSQPFFHTSETLRVRVRLGTLGSWVHELLWRGSSPPRIGAFSGVKDTSLQSGGSLKPVHPWWSLDPGTTPPYYIPPLTKLNMAGSSLLSLSSQAPPLLLGIKPRASHVMDRTTVPTYALGSVSFRNCYSYENLVRELLCLSVYQMPSLFPQRISAVLTLGTVGPTERRGIADL